MAWGGLYAVCLLIEKLVPGLKNLPKLLRHGYTMAIVVLGFVLFNAESMSQAGSDLMALFGFRGLPLVSEQTLYYLRSYAPLFLMGLAGATPLAKQLGLKLGGTKAGPVLELVMLAALLLVCTAYLVDGSFSPFLYFRF